MTREWSSTRLNNGLQIVAVQVPRSPLAELRLVVPFARVHHEYAAAQELLATCLGTGTRFPDDRPNRNRRDISDLAADLGAELGTVVTAESLIMSAAVLSVGLSDLLRLVGDILVRPHYGRDELEIAQARASATIPGDNISAQMRRAALLHGYGDHPLSSGCAGVASPLEDMLACAVEDLYCLHSQTIVPEGSLLLLQADGDPERLIQHAGEALRDWKGGPSHLTLTPFPHPRPKPGRVRLQPTAKADPASHVLAIGPALCASEPHQAAFHLATTVLGGHPNARLQRHLRDELGLSYAPQVDTRETAAGCWLEIWSRGAPGSGESLTEAVCSTLRGFAENGPNPAELERARAHARGFTMFALSTRAETATALAGIAAAGLPLNWLTDYRAALDAVTIEEVAKAARSFLHPDGMVTVTSDP